MSKSRSPLKLSVSFVMSFSMIFLSFPLPTHAAGNPLIPDDLFGTSSTTSNKKAAPANAASTTNTTSTTTPAANYSTTTGYGSYNGRGPYYGGYYGPGSYWNYQDFDPNSPNSPLRPTVNSMTSPQLPQEYACPLLDNKSHADMLAAIDALNSSIQSNPDCNKNPSADNIIKTNEDLKTAITNLKGFIDNSGQQTPDATGVESNLNVALTSISNLGSVVNNSALLNSACGKETMSAGKFFIALNDLISGITPYALFAVSMHASLAVALPYIAGAAVVTTGISLFAQSYQKNRLAVDTNPDVRKAILKNTCQYVKVARKARFIELAQSGQIKKITEELDHETQLYKGSISKSSDALKNLLSTRQATLQQLSYFESQLNSDRGELLNVQAELKDSAQNKMLICMVGEQLVAKTTDYRAFPASAFNNLKSSLAAASVSDNLQQVTLDALNETTKKQLTALRADIDQGKTAAVEQCSQATLAWTQGMDQAVRATGQWIAKAKSDLETQLSQNAEYRKWKSQYNDVQSETILVDRFQKAMVEMSKSNSVVDRSEMDQRLTSLKAGLFGQRNALTLHSSPVMAWLDHMSGVTGQSVSAFSRDMDSLANVAISVDPNQGANYVVDSLGSVSAQNEIAMNEARSHLKALTLKTVKMGTRSHELVCQALVNAWLDWTAVTTHLGASKFFCDMIDPYIDGSMESGIPKFCRGGMMGTNYFGSSGVSTVESTRQMLIKKGYRDQAMTVSAKINDLQCPMPTLSSSVN